MKKNVTILLVEDEHDLRKTMTLSLASMYTVVIPASNGIEAMELLSKHSIDIVITDLHMPSMCGVDLIEAIRSTYNDDPMPIIITSGYSDISAKYLDVPCISVIGKPVDARELIITINRLVESNKEVCKTRENLNKISSIYDEAKKLMDILKANKPFQCKE